MQSRGKYVIISTDIVTAHRAVSAEPQKAAAQPPEAHCPERTSYNIDRYFYKYKEGVYMWTTAELKMRGKMAFRRNYWPSVVVALVMSIFAGGTVSSNVMRRITDDGDSYGIGSQTLDSSESMAMAMFLLIAASVAAILGLVFMLLRIFVGNLLMVGGSKFFIDNQTGTPSAGTLGFGFKSGHYGNIVLTMFLRELFTGLWTLLFIIPGIIKHYEYLMIPYILAENPGMSRQEAFAISKRMMMGQKMNTFALDLSFIGWGILSAITFGIVGIFYVNPYMEATYAELYAYNRSAAYQSGYIR